MGQLPGQDGAFLQRDAGYRYQGQYIGGTAAGMGSVMLPHINQFLRFGGAAEGGFAYGSGFPHESNDGTVGGLAGVYIQHFDAFHRADGGYNGVYHLTLPSFTVIGNTFDELLH